MKFWLFVVIFIFGSFMVEVFEKMVKDENAGIRAVGFAIAVVGAIFVLWLVLVCFFQINLLELVP